MKKITLLLTIVVYSLTISCQIPTTGLLGYYPFNGNANDASGNAQHGSVSGAVLTTDRFGNSSSAYVFNGSSDYISLPAGTFTNLNLYSYSCWIKPNTSTLPGFVMCFGESSNGYCQTLVYQATGSVSAGAYNSGSNPTQSLIHSSTTFSSNQWLHLVMTRDFSSIKLYVNGVFYTSTSASTGNQNASYGSNLPIKAFIGARTTAVSYFNGVIDDVRIYNNAITQNDVLALYNENCFQSYTPTYTTCAGTAATMTAIPAASNTITWYSSPTSTNSLGSGSLLSTPTLSTAGVYTYYAAASTCTNNTRLPFTVTVSSTPTISAANGNICSGNSFTINPVGASTYTYSGGTNIVSPNVTTTYTVIGKNASNCLSNVASLTVDVNASPTVNVNSGFVCSGNSFTLSPTGATSYTYSGGSAIVSPLSNTTYTVTGSNGNGCIGSAVSNVGVVANPTVSVSGAGGICTGNSATLTASGANYYTWSTGSTNTVIVTTPVTTTNYIVTGINIFGCIDTKIVSVTVNPLPTIIVNSGAVCLGSSFTITPSGASTYTYSGGSSIVSPTSNTSYSVTGTSAEGCLSSNTAISSVTVNPLPVINVNSGTICSGDAFTMTPSGGISYTYSGGSAVVFPTTSANYTVTGADANGCKNNAISSVTTIALPVISISGPSDICSGSSANLTASGASSYTWNTGATSTGISVSPSANTTYSVSGIAASGCRNITSHLLSVNPLPVISVNSGSICSGDSFTIVASGASSYTYSGGNNIVSPSSSTNYSVTGTSAQGCVSSNTAVSSVSVVSLPVISVNSGTICSGKSFTIVASGAATYSYSGGSPVVSPLVNTNYTVTGFNASGCSSSTVATVVVDALPNVSITGTNSVCSGNSALLTASGASSYSWNTGASTSTVSVSPTNTNTYTVIGTALNGCSNTASSILTVNPLPFISVNSGSICLGNSFTMNPSGASTYTYSSGTNIVSPTGSVSYSITGTSSQGCISSNTAVASVTVVSLPIVTVNSGSICTGDVFTLNPSGAVSYTYSGGSATVNPSSNSSYTVTGTSAQGCISAPAVSNVTVIALPVLSVAGGSICTGSNFTFNPTGAVSYTYSGGSSIVSPTTTTSYSITGSNSAGCISSVSVVQVTVHSLPTIGVNSGNLCIGSTFTMVPTGAATYTYSNGSNTVSPTSNSTYTVTGTSAQGCLSSNVAISSVTVIPLPIVSVNSGSICAGSSFTMSPTGASSYNYSGGSATVSPTSNSSYTVTGTDSFGCVSLPVVANVTVNALPSVTVTGNATVCAGSTAVLTATGAINYTWSTGAMASSITVTPTANTIYTVTGQTLQGCTRDFTHMVIINPLPVISATGGVICVGGTYTIPVSGASTYSFSSGSATVNPGTTTSYSITGFSTAGCLSASPAIVTVTVNPLPTLSIIAQNTICSGNSATLTALGANSYTWNTGQTNSTLVVSPTTNTVYSVNGLDVNGCSGSSTIQIVVNPLPTITIASGAICPGNSFTLNPSGANTYTYSGGSNIVSPTSSTSYSIYGTSIDGCDALLPAIATVSVVNTLTVTVSGTTQVCSGEELILTANGASTYSWNTGLTTNTVALNPGTSTSYTVTGISGTCSDVAVFTVTVNPLPIISVNSGTVCSGSSFTIVPTGASSYTYSAGTAIVNPMTSTDYTVIGSDLNGCVSSAVSSVTVHALPLVSATATSTFLCDGETSTLEATGAISYSWNTGSTDNPYVVNPTTTTDYTLVGVDINGCSNFTTVLITVNPCTGVSRINNTSLEFKLYPNPNNGQFMITLSHPGSGKILIEDIEGKVLYEYNLSPSDTTIGFNRLEIKPGLYFCRIVYNDKDVRLKKLVITE